MPTPPPYLPTLIQAQSLLERLAKTNRSTVRAVRVVGALYLIPYRTTRQVAALLGCSYGTALLGVNEAKGREWITYGPRNYRLQCTLDGLSLAGRMQVGERAARVGITWPEPPAPKRDYVKSGKFIGKYNKYKPAK